MTRAKVRVKARIAKLKAARRILNGFLAVGYNVSAPKAVDAINTILAAEESELRYTR